MRLDLGGGRWWAVRRCDVAARLLADAHYSRQTPGAQEFMPPGRTLVLLTDDERAVWAVIEHLDPAGNLVWRNTIFRNVGAGLSSDLVREATARTFLYWRREYGALPPVPLRTEVDPDKTRRKRDPGRCYRRAGWVPVGMVNGLFHLHAPASVAGRFPADTSPGSRRAFFEANQ